MFKRYICFRELEIKIKTFLGKFTSKIVNNSHARNLILTGGDIALKICKELGISNLTILDELLPGIPLSASYHENIHINIVTKAGGFGGEDNIYKLIPKLKNY